jgi:hypothetical protein
LNTKPVVVFVVLSGLIPVSSDLPFNAVFIVAIFKIPPLQGPPRERR